MDPPRRSEGHTDSRVPQLPRCRERQDRVGAGAPGRAGSGDGSGAVGHDELHLRGAALARASERDLSGGAPRARAARRHPDQVRPVHRTLVRAVAAAAPGPEPGCDPCRRDPRLGDGENRSEDGGDRPEDPGHGAHVRRRVGHSQAHGHGARRGSAGRVHARGRVAQARAGALPELHPLLRRCQGRSFARGEARLGPGRPTGQNRRRVQGVRRDGLSRPDPLVRGARDGSRPAEHARERPGRRRDPSRCAVRGDAVVLGGRSRARHQGRDDLRGARARPGQHARA